MSDSSKHTYCICRSKNDSRFMICCDSCNVWFHGNCVGIKADLAKTIKHYYCSSCRTKHGLSIEFKKTHAAGLSDSSDCEQVKKKSRKECGDCIGCFRTEDCGRCDYCKTMKSEDSATILNSMGPNRPLKCRLRCCVNESDTVKSPVRTQSPAASTRLFSTTSVHPQPVKKKDPAKTKIKLAAAAKVKTLLKKKPVGGSPSINLDNSVVSSRQPLSTCLTSNLPSTCSGSTRSSKRKLKTFMKEAGVLKDDDTMSPKDDLLRQCYGPGCVLPARKGSKYCSDETCGLRLARARLLEILPGRLQQWSATPSVAEEFERQRLIQIEIQIENAKRKLTEMTDEEQRLSTYLEDATSVKWDGQPEKDNEEEEGNNVHCPTCGHETSAKTALRHIIRCFSKYENQTSFGSTSRTLNNVYNIFCDAYNKTSQIYCKRLRVICPEHQKEPKIDDDEICACPLTQGLIQKIEKFVSVTSCKAQKKSCARHYKWDKIRRATIDMERLSQLLKLDELYEEQRTLKQASKMRGGVLSLLLNQTIDHTAKDEDSTIMQSGKDLLDQSALNKQEHTDLV